MLITLKNIFLKYLKSEAFKVLALKLFGTATIGGIKAFIVKIIVKYGFKYIAKPIAEEVIRQGYYQYDRLNGTISIKKMQKAKDEKNQNDYDKSIDDILD